MRGGLIVIEAGRVALIERRRAGLIYYLFPGGQVDAGETPADAAVREGHEELGLHVELDRLAAIITFHGAEQHFFLATRVAGEFGSGTGAELKATPESDEGTYRPVWLPFGDLLAQDVRPRPIAEAIASGSILCWNVERFVEE